MFDAILVTSIVGKLFGCRAHIILECALGDCKSNLHNFHPRFHRAIKRHMFKIVLTSK